MVAEEAALSLQIARISALMPVWEFVVKMLLQGVQVRAKEAAQEAAQEVVVLLAREVAKEKPVIQLTAMLLVAWLIILAPHGLMAPSLNPKPSSTPTKPP